MVSASSNQLSLPGYWDPFPRASIDFCEPNYTQSYYVAEVLNSVSSLAIAYLGVVGIYRTYLRSHVTDCAFEKKCFYYLYTCALLIGLGSTCLHATLTAVGQAADEIPMLLSNVPFFALMLEIKSEPNNIKNKWLPPFIWVAWAFSVGWYLYWQENYFMFLLFYIGSVVTLVSWMASLCFVKRSDKWEEEKRKQFLVPYFCYAMGAYAVLGFGSWITDMLLCETILASSFKFLQAFMHPVWHLGAMLGTHLAVCLVAMFRAIAMKKEFEVRSFGGLPFVEVIGNGKAKKK
ncbi:hypothetical protein TL16_g05569 [Triparma laevis f. inornata]|uniref:Alkaline phytoceramidase n=2 Tax=Triparma laevis TaxID=1534972 RepID=A0A9W6ZKS2_9STRA|nr:hypothetical protein TrLO_g5956 [Triparma laevis f. longispina]GMH71120.1 hypothetical protein TL16_g05569 [Triparma laevis f. inornata]